MTATVGVRELRNEGGKVLARVQRGESITLTSAGRPMALLVPLPGEEPTPRELIKRWRKLPPIDAASFRAELDEAIEAEL